MHLRLYGGGEWGAGCGGEFTRGQMRNMYSAKSHQALGTFPTAHKGVRREDDLSGSCAPCWGREPPSSRPVGREGAVEFLSWAVGTKPGWSPSNRARQLSHPCGWFPERCFGYPRLTAHGAVGKAGKGGLG